MLWLQSCIIVILIKAAISFTSFCSEYDGASSKTPRHLMYVSEWQRERERLSFLWTKTLNGAIVEIIYPTFSPLSAICFHHFEIYFAFVTFFSTVLFSLSSLRGRRICHSFKISFARSHFFSTLFNLFSDFSSLLCILFSSAVKRSVDFKSRGVKLFPGKDSSNKFSICEFTS